MMAVETQLWRIGNAVFWFDAERRGAGTFAGNRFVTTHLARVYKRRIDPCLFRKSAIFICEFSRRLFQNITGFE